MNYSNYRITLDVRNTVANVQLTAKKGDAGRKIYITLSDKGKPCEIADDSYAVFAGVKPDGTKLYNKTTIENNTIIYEMTQQTTAVAGLVACEVKLFDSMSNLLTSPKLTILVDDVVVPDEEIVSKDEVSALAELILDVTATGTMATEAADTANTAAGNANAAAQAANDAAASANRAAEVADTAANNASTKAAIVTQAATTANTAADSAYMAAGTANEAANTANAAAEETLAAKEAFLENAQEVLEAVHAAVTAPAIVCESSGEVITLTDSSDRLLQGLTLYGRTTQNGTPAPEAPVALESAGSDGSIGVSVTGKNLFDKDNFKAMSAYISDGVITAYSSATRTVFYIPCAPNTTYTVSRVAVYAGERLGLGWTEDVPKVGSYVNNNKTPTLDATVGSVISRTLTTGATAKYLVCYLGWTSRTEEAATCQIEVGSVATAYEPYKGQTITAQTPNGLPGIPVSSGGNYTDESGQQWVCDEIDFARGVYVQRVGQADFATLEWTPTDFSNEVQKGYYTRISGIYQSRGNILHTHYRWLGYEPYTADFGRAIGSTQGDFDARTIGEIGFCGKGGGRDTFGVVVGINDGTPVGELQYVLTTPIETPLSAEELAQYAALHSNKPNTTVYNDSGVGMEVSYVADTKMYIDNKFAQISAAILNA